MVTQEKWGQETRRKGSENRAKGGRTQDNLGWEQDKRVQEPRRNVGRNPGEMVACSRCSDIGERCKELGNDVENSEQKRQENGRTAWGKGMPVNKLLTWSFRPQWTTNSGIVT